MGQRILLSLGKVQKIKRKHGEMKSLPFKKEGQKISTLPRFRTHIARFSVFGLST